jgi:4'-phosphopantetheinyl transferase EntD
MMQKIETLFDPIEGVVAMWTSISSQHIELHQSERQSVVNSVPKRRLEFAAGRDLARRALTAIGQDPVEIPVGPERLPIWPAGVSGSISHTDSRVAVAICQTHCYRGVGLDIETERALSSDLVESVMTSDERQRYPLHTVDPAIFFSCKESVYKAVYARHAEFLDFHDVEIEYRDDQFTATCKAGKKSAAWISVGVGSISFSHGHIATIFLI